jgi:hypothetical protein
MKYKITYLSIILVLFGVGKSIAGVPTEENVFSDEGVINISSAYDFKNIDGSAFDFYLPAGDIALYGNEWGDDDAPDGPPTSGDLSIGDFPVIILSLVIFSYITIIGIRKFQRRREPTKDK